MSNVDIIGPLVKKMQDFGWNLTLERLSAYQQSIIFYISVKQNLQERIIEGWSLPITLDADTLPLLQWLFKSEMELRIHLIGNNLQTGRFPAQIGEIVLTFTIQHPEGYMHNLENFIHLSGVEEDDDVYLEDGRLLIEDVDTYTVPENAITHIERFLRKKVGGCLRRIVKASL